MSLVAEPAIRVSVLVTFLRMDQPPATPAPKLPADAEVRLEAGCTAERYRELYNTVGAPYVWWLRRTMPDRALAALLRDPRVSIHVLYRGTETCGFYELDRTPWPAVNLSYFGLVPASVGTGLGYPFLGHAVATAWGLGARAVTVNTCTADHPRALPTYIRAGFRPVREVREEWNVPIRLGLDIPDSLRI